MFDIIEIAMKKGRDEGEETGIKKGRTEGEVIGTQKMVLELLIAKFNLIPQHIAAQIKKIQEADVLRGLFHAIVKCENINEFEATLSRV